LGLMTVIGQPKTTSEYIQATSRVGRSKKGPGLVFTIYNCSKPRDRSHFEHFQEYHSKIYSKVEPTSVTPFSAPARERALHAILIGLIRMLTTNDEVSKKPKPFPPLDLLNEVQNIIFNRVLKIEKEEYDSTLKLLAEKINEWQMELPIEYGGFGNQQTSVLMYPAGSAVNENLKGAWSTPTSMRNVDSTCDAYIMPRDSKYINIDEV